MSSRKVIRYFTIYGFFRTVVKVAGRSRNKYLRLFFMSIFWRRKANISLIGCGQFGFSTISYFLLRKNGNHFLECFDIDEEQQKTTADFWGYVAQPDVSKLIMNNQCKFVYIASNHASHTDYAIKALQKGRKVYIEKPLSVNYQQLSSLLCFRRDYFQNNDAIFIGYNRPFSPAILKLNSWIKGSFFPITLNCFVIGHFIEKNHWYRNPEEGTRICGNVGHWIDLSINLLNTRGNIAHLYTISISYSNSDEIDDNISISMVTELNDLITIIITSRSEPFEGINESIQFHSGDIIAKINDFRQMYLWKGSKKMQYRFNPKDVGHSNAINQPFNGMRRDFTEIEVSTVIMLEITDMVKKKEKLRVVEPFMIINQLLN